MLISTYLATKDVTRNTQAHILKSIDILMTWGDKLRNGLEAESKAEIKRDYLAHTNA